MPLPPAVTQPGFVYVVGPLEGCVKIGQSRVLAERLANMGKAPVELPVIATIATEHPRWLEKYLHKAFKDRHARGEWFRLTEGDLAMLTGLTRADAEVDLPQVIRDMHGVTASRRSAKAREVVLAGEVTTTKVRKSTMKHLRLIGAYLDIKQEDVIDLFASCFAAKWEELLASSRQGA